MAPPQHVVIGWDTSGSNREVLPAQVRAGIRLIRRLSPDRDYLSLYRVDATTQELFDNPPLASRDQLQTLLFQELRTPAKQPGTHPGTFWVIVSARARSSQRPLTVVFFTDGEDEQPGALTSSQKAAIEELAANRRVVKITIVGVKSETRASLRRALAPLGNRLEIRGSGELRSDLPVGQGR